MHNEAGLVRAHCLLARALLFAGRIVEAEQVAHAAESELALLEGSAGPAKVPLVAQIKRARGELFMHNGNGHQARRLLLEAATVFGQHDDWAAQSDVLDKLNNSPLLRSRELHSVPVGHDDTVDREPVKATVEPTPRQRQVDKRDDSDDLAS
jgi:hypothetical protein